MAGRGRGGCVGGSGGCRGSSWFRWLLAVAVVQLGLLVSAGEAMRGSLAPGRLPVTGLPALGQRPLPPLAVSGARGPRALVVRGGGFQFQTGEALTRVTTLINSLGPGAPLGFAAAYIGCELVSMPPAPLAISAGAIFGMWVGTALVIASGVISAALR